MANGKKKDDEPRLQVVEKEKPNKEHKRNVDCVDGYHAYMITQWQVGSGKEKAIQVRCQFCLMPMDLTELESLEWQKKEGM